MTYGLINGDYVRGVDGKLLTVDGVREVLQNVMLQLTATRGRFYPNKDFGSDLKTKMQAPPEAYALAYARQALGDTDGVFVTKATVNLGDIVFTLQINNSEEEVSISLEDDV